MTYFTRGNVCIASICAVLMTSASLFAGQATWSTSASAYVLCYNPSPGTSNIDPSELNFGATSFANAPLVRVQDFGSYQATATANASRGFVTTSLTQNITLDPAMTGAARQSFSSNQQASAYFSATDFNVSGPAGSEGSQVPVQLNFTPTMALGISGGWSSFVADDLGDDRCRWYVRVATASGTLVEIELPLSSPGLGETYTTPSFFVPVGVPFSAEIFVNIRVRGASARQEVGGPNQASSAFFGSIFFGGLDTLTRARTPVLNLPDGYTLNSEGAMINDNTYTGEIPAPGVSVLGAVALIATARRRR